MMFTNIKVIKVMLLSERFVISLPWAYLYSFRLFTVFKPPTCFSSLFMSLPYGTVMHPLLPPARPNISLTNGGVALILRLNVVLLVMFLT